METVCVHVNSRYVDSNKHDLDVYDSYTLQCAIQSLARDINGWMEMGKPEKAQPYLDFKNRIKKHLLEN
jgi:hypothetical protein